MTGSIMKVGEIAKLYGVRRETIGEIAMCNNLIPKHVPGQGNGNAKGYDRDDRRVIERALGRTRTRRRVIATS